MVAAELHNLAYVELHDGQPVRAKELFAKARVEARRLGYEGLRPYLLGDAAVIAAEEGDADRAARLYGAAQAAFGAAGQVPDPDDAAEQERLRARVAAVLGNEGFRAACDVGARLTFEEAVGDRL